MKIGDRVTHTLYPEFFGHGTVIEVEESTNFPDHSVHSIQWDKDFEGRVDVAKIDRGYFTGALRKLNVLELMAET